MFSTVKSVVFFFIIISVGYLLACTSGNGQDGEGESESEGQGSRSCADDGIACTTDRLADGGDEGQICQHFPQHALCPPGQVCDPVDGCTTPQVCETVADCEDRGVCEPVECDLATSTCLYRNRDLDHDGYPPRGCGGDDCWDDPGSQASGCVGEGMCNGADVYPGAEEICDGTDNNCNGAVDDLVANQPCPDPSAPVEMCGVLVCKEGRAACEGGLIGQPCDGPDNDRDEEGVYIRWCRCGDWNDDGICISWRLPDCSDDTGDENPDDPPYDPTEGCGLDKPAIDLTAASGPVDYCEDQSWEPDNNTFEGALELITAGSPPWTFGTLETCYPGDVDFWKWSIREGDRVTVTVEFTYMDGDLDVALLDPDGRIVAVAQRCLDNEILTITATDDGMWRVAVVGYAGAVNTYMLRFDRE